MIRDNELVFSDAQAVTATALSTDVYDTGEQGHVLGFGEPMDVVVTVGAAFSGLTSLQAQLVASDSADLSGAVVINAGPVVAAADLTAGADVFKGKIGIGEPYRYYGFNYVVDGVGTGGTVNATIGLGQPEHFYGESAF